MFLLNGDGLRDQLERNHANIQGGKAEERQANIDAMPNRGLLLAGKAIQQTLFNFAKLRPETAQKIIGGEPEEFGYEYIGAGSLFTAVIDTKDPQTVIKILRKSLHWNQAQRYDEASRIDELHHKISEYLGSLVVGQTVTIDDHPLYPKNTDKRVLMIHQPRIEYEPTLIFDPYRPIIDKDRMNELEHRFPGLMMALGYLASASLLMYEETQLLPDTSGLDNVVIANPNDQPSLRLLDGIPLDGSNKSDRKRIVGQLKELDRHLAPFE